MSIRQKITFEIAYTRERRHVQSPDDSECAIQIVVRPQKLLHPLAKLHGDAILVQRSNHRRCKKTLDSTSETAEVTKWQPFFSKNVSLNSRKSHQQPWQVETGPVPVEFQYPLYSFICGFCRILAGL